MSQELNTQALVEKWAPVLDAEGASSIVEQHKRQVTAVVLENQEKAMNEQNATMQNFNEDMTTGEVPVSSVGAAWDPILISLVRRATPNLIAFDVAGVQAMSGPTGLIFAMKSEYKPVGSPATEALHDVVDTSFSGMHTTAAAEALGSPATPMATMGFSIEKTSVTAQTRALKANYTMELAQDLKAVHGLSAETELANILSTEILAEINREVIETMETQAIVGAPFDATVLTGTSGGRWEVEVFKGLLYHVAKEANQIALDTRRGKGNFIICSSDVAAAFNATGSMDYGLVASTTVDATGSLLAGTVQGMKVFVDPFALPGSVVVGYKGTNPYDAGMFYCPYVPLSMMKTIGENDFQPRIGFKTRYGMAANPFVSDTIAAGTGINPYFRSVAVSNL